MLGKKCWFDRIVIMYISKIVSKKEEIVVVCDKGFKWLINSNSFEKVMKLELLVMFNYMVWIFFIKVSYFLELNIVLVMICVYKRSFC